MTGAPAARVGGPLVSRFEPGGGVAVRVTSRDTRLRSYRPGPRFEGMLRRDADALASFRGTARPGGDGFAVPAPSVRARRLEVVVPPAGLTDGEVAAINSATRYAASLGVRLALVVGYD